MRIYITEQCWFDYLGHQVSICDLLLGWCKTLLKG